ncbi:hypothetical protein K1X76_05655 [bacterium]|nr:hypothetical protein [bacterium]
MKFKRDVLVRELLNLGNSKITSNIAKLVGDEVEKEIFNRRIGVLTTDTLNAIVTEKLVALGLADDVAATEENKTNGHHPILSQDVLRVLLPAEEKKKAAPEVIPLVQKEAISYLPDAQQKIVSVAAKRDFGGNVQEFCDGILERAARALTQADIHFDPRLNSDKIENEWYNFLASGVFLPTLDVLSHLGSLWPQTSPAFTVEDQASSLSEGLQHLIENHQAGRSSFIELKLRAAGDVIGGKTLNAVNPQELLKFYAQGLQLYPVSGSTTHSVSLSLSHPQSDLFLNALLENQNFFKGIFAPDREFLQALNQDDFVSLLNPRTGSLVRKVPVNFFLEKFVDLLSRDGELKFYFPHQIAATPGDANSFLIHPCHAQAFKPGNKTLLGSLNIFSCVHDGNLNWGLLKNAVYRAVHFLDNVLCLSSGLEKEIDVARLSLNICGWAMVLMEMGIPYDSREALLLAQEVCGFIHEEAMLCSAQLALKRGVPQDLHRQDGPVVRHAAFVGIDGDEEVASIFGVTPGLEPLDDERQILVKSGSVFTVEALESLYLKERKMSKSVFKKGHEILAAQHLYMQQVCERYADGLVDKKIPLTDLSPEGVKNILVAAHRLNLKTLHVVHLFKEKAVSVFKASFSDKGNYFMP